MSGRSWKTLLVVGVVAATMGVAVSQADACWGCGGYYYPATYVYTTYYTPAYTSCYSCYTPCAVSCYDPCCGSSCGWYVGYRPGPVRRLLLGPYRYYYGCDYGCGCASSCYTASSCGCGETSYAPMQTTPTEAPTPPQEPTYLPDMVPAPAAPPSEPAVDLPGGVQMAPPETNNRVARETSGLLTIYVPYDAKVEVNGQATKSVGSRRQYVSYGLQPGYTYRYEIRAQVVRDGEVVEDVRTVTLTAGEKMLVTFGFNPTPNTALAAR